MQTMEAPTLATGETENEMIDRCEAETEACPAELRGSLELVQVAEVDGAPNAPALRAEFNAKLAEFNAKATVEATLGAAPASFDGETDIINKMVALCVRSRDLSTAVAFRIGAMAQQVKDLNHKAMPTLPRGGKDGTAGPALRRVWARISHEAPWMAKGGHVTEYVKVHHLRAELGDDAPTIGRVSFECLRVLASCVAHDEIQDTFALKVSVAIDDKKTTPADYRTYLINRIAELSAAPENSKKTRDALRDWEADVKKASLSAKDAKRLDAEAKANEANAKDAKRAAFLGSIAVQAAKLGIDNAELEAHLVKNDIIADRIVVTESGEAGRITDPADMTLDQLAEFAKLLIQSGDDKRIGEVWRPLAAYAAETHRAKKAGAPRPSLNDAPGVNVIPLGKTG